MEKFIPFSEFDQDLTKMKNSIPIPPLISFSDSRPKTMNSPVNHHSMVIKDKAQCPARLVPIAKHSPLNHPIKVATYFPLNIINMDQFEKDMKIPEILTNVVSFSELMKLQKMILVEHFRLHTCSVPMVY
jgi:hypothetical protein